MDARFQFERKLAKKEKRVVVGMDEVGRGAVAGPLVVAAVELPVLIEGLKDSKQLTRKARVSLSKLINEKAAQIEIVSVSARLIDENGMSWALKSAYTQLVSRFDSAVFLTDNVKLDAAHISSIKGDSVFYSCSAASIVAKVFRDNLMKDIVVRFPEFQKYGWENNVGYGTKQHFEVIKQYGTTKLHRKTFLKRLVGP